VKLFTLFYYFLTLLLFVVASPFLVYMAFKSKYKRSVPARFFMLGNRPLPRDDKSVWFHACSLGETVALTPIVKELENLNPAITVTTQTGFNAATKLVKKARYLPYEAWLPFWVRRHKKLVVLEAELWYMLFLMAKIRGTQTALLNARISDKSYRSYKKMAWFYRRLFKYVDKVFCQSEIDKERLVELGAKDVEVIGNIKLANKVVTTKSLEKPKTRMFVAASTHESEEALILDAYANYLKTTDLKSSLVMVPRHPERFDSVHKMMLAFAKDKGLSYHRYSEDSHFNADLVLVDVLGELINIYAISDVVILGGGFAPIGGHNPLEPASFSNKIISGKEYFNQKGLFPLVKNLKVVENSELTEALENVDEMEMASIDGSVELAPFYQWIHKD
jgi:3-deoxy-D-manno-octulosonic-acid transferase